MFYGRVFEFTVEPPITDTVMLDFDYNTAQKLKPGEKISKRFLAKLEAGDTVTLAHNRQ